MKLIAPADRRAVRRRVQATLGAHAWKSRTTVADLADKFAHQFFEEHMNTADIARAHGVTEAAVYNALHAWREAGR